MESVVKVEKCVPISVGEEEKNENAEPRTIQVGGAPLMDWDKGVVGWDSETDALNPVSDLPVVHSLILEC
jgi:hypothetical protein